MPNRFVVGIKGEIVDETLSLPLLHEHSKAPTMGQGPGLALEIQ